jgi:hypothetical protein
MQGKRALPWGNHSTLMRVFIPPQRRVRRLISYYLSRARRSADRSWSTLSSPVSAAEMLPRGALEVGQATRKSGPFWLRLRSEARNAGWGCNSHFPFPISSLHQNWVRLVDCIRLASSGQRANPRDRGQRASPNYAEGH